MKVVCFDLDDTLYKEIDYLKSAYREIANYAAERCHGCSDSPIILAAKAYDAMFAAYKSGEDAFKCLNGFLGVNLPISEYLQIYRQHKPNINLSEEFVQALDLLKENGYIIGLITDGRSVQQRNKIEALGLNRWIANDDIVISEEFGCEKPSLANYEYFMKRYPECNDFTYVGDNPLKDFIAPNTLGWTTICLLDDGRNIHKQDLKTSVLEQQSLMSIKNISGLFAGSSCLSIME